VLYFDHNASTPLHGEVLDEMMPYLQSNFANPSSVHQQGRLARQAIDRAREQVAALVNAHPSQVIFTSGGSEANNLAISGSVRGMGLSRLMIAATEHPSVRDTAKQFESSLVLDELKVDSGGVIDKDFFFDKSNSFGQGLVSVMLANNETGVIQNLNQIGKVAQSHGHVMHTDAVQAAGKIDVDFSALPVNLLTLSAHKIYGPKGIGALVFDKSIDLMPMIFGGGQERKRRSGTENVAAIAGFGKAAELALTNLSNNRTYLLELQNYFENQLEKITGIIIFSKRETRLPNTTFFGLPGIDGESLLMQLDTHGIAVTSGSACASTSLKPSHVLLAMGVEVDVARSAIRVSFGVENTKAQIDELIKALYAQQQLFASLESIEI